ncbi:hypothetical protein [Cohnella yongneupensis]|uniref:Uncharacterized protein n=1 Tax=Cohnella yongneupensis TaxID=425006 RepID=A0ABW0R070_9BACL
MLLCRFSRTIDGFAYELHNTREECEIYRDGRFLCRFPAGVRIVTDRGGNLRSVVGMSVRQIEGGLMYSGSLIEVRVAGNEVLQLVEGKLVTRSAPGVVMPTYE